MTETSRLRPRSGRSKILARLGIFVAIFAVASTTALPVAYAASYKYANDVATKAGQERTSGLRSSVSGGKAYTHVNVGTTTIISYYNYPGYTELGYAEGPDQAYVYFSHATCADAYSKCYWEYANSGGTAVKMNCWVNS